MFSCGNSSSLVWKLFVSGVEICSLYSEDLLQEWKFVCSGVYFFCLYSMFARAREASLIYITDSLWIRHMSPEPKVASSRRACSLFSFSFLPCVLGAKHYHTRDGVADSASESSALEASSRRLLAYPGTAPRALVSWPE